MSSLRRAGCLAARAALGVSSRARTAWEPAVATTLAPRARAWGMGGGTSPPMHSVNPRRVETGRSVGDT
eukprot:5527666-Pyramimonas_sp.AAC.1